MVMKLIAAILLWLTGVLFGFALAAWALYEPVPTGPAKYTFTRSAPAVPPYTLDGSRKLMRIECISTSEKDCPQATTVPEPSALLLLGIGIIALVTTKTYQQRSGLAHED